MTATRNTAAFRRPGGPILGSVVGFSILIAVCAQIAMPFYPVPITMQTGAVLLAGAMLGAHCGTASVALYLGLALAGLPILANGAGGFAAATGASAGYLIGFPAAAFIAGWAAEQGRLDRALPGLATLLAAHAVTLATGVGWLIVSVGLDPVRAIEVGALPFLIGAVVKSALVLVVLRIWRRARFKPA